MFNWGYLSPEIVDDYVNFSRKNKEWTYNINESTMEKKQAEGAAYIWNILSEKNIAILADEVGMGKTIQALSICATLWRKNPSAKVLVFAPREAVSLNWENEYKNFINTHYRIYDDLVKTSINGLPIHKAILCNNIYNLCDKVLEGWGKFFIAKTTSLSGLIGQFRGKNPTIFDNRKIKIKMSEFEIEPPDRIYKEEDAKELAGWIGNKLREKLLKEGCFFDLIIIDEAHYFRNIDINSDIGDSQRVTAAKGFFGEGTEKLCKKVLLMTATPNHSSPNNIKSIVSYFDANLKEKTPEDILNEICIRRFRTLSNKGLIKYNYRHVNGN